MKTIYFDCFSGISGDMTVGALIDAGVPFQAVDEAMASLAIEGFRLAAEKVNKKGVMATWFQVHLDPEMKQPHRHLRHVVEIIDRGELPDPVKEGAKETFRRLAEAEAAVHGTTIEKVHFHEVGAIDSIVDIVAAHFCLHYLGIERVIASPLHVGSGTVKCAHGVMPVPAPATARLLVGKPTYGGDVQGELVTPTGAALMAHLARSFGGAPGLKVEHIGYGCGTRDIADRPNVLRVLVGEQACAGDGPCADETITVVEANLDDMTGELFPPLVEALLAAGARDAFLTPVLGKKGRPAHLVTALCDAARLDAVTDALFVNSTTLGLRIREERRIVLDREWKEVSTPWGGVKVKIGRRGGALHTAAPEYEACRAVAAAAGVPVRRVYEAALAAAQQEK